MTKQVPCPSLAPNLFKTMNSSLSASSLRDLIIFYVYAYVQLPREESDPSRTLNSSRLPLSRPMGHDVCCSQLVAGFSLARSVDVVVPSGILNGITFSFRFGSIVFLKLIDCGSLNEDESNIKHAPSSSVYLNSSPWDSSLRISRRFTLSGFVGPSATHVTKATDVSVSGVIYFGADSPHGLQFRKGTTLC